MQYLVKDEQGNLSVIGAVGFVPRNVVARVPDSINPEDYEFIETETIKDDEFETERVIIRVDEEKKTQVLSEREQQRQKQEVLSQARNNNKNRLIENLRRSNASGPLRDLIELYLSDKGIFINEGDLDGKS
jgi:hypothetical protein